VFRRPSQLSTANVEHEPRRTAPFPNGDVTTVSQVSTPSATRTDLHGYVAPRSVPDGRAETPAAALNRLPKVNERVRCPASTPLRPTRTPFHLFEFRPPGSRGRPITPALTAKGNRTTALQATVIVYAIEIDVVRARHLWPRSIIQPSLTDADRSYYAAALRAEAQRPERRLRIAYKTKSDTGQ
jgi:hypothetical protein